MRRCVRLCRFLRILQNVSNVRVYMRSVSHRSGSIASRFDERECVVACIKKLTLSLRASLAEGGESCVRHVFLVVFSFYGRTECNIVTSLLIARLIRPYYETHFVMISTQEGPQLEGKFDFCYDICCAHSRHGAACCRL